MAKTYSLCSSMNNVEHFGGPKVSRKESKTFLFFFYNQRSVSILQFPICIGVFPFVMILVMEHLDYLHQIRKHYEFEFDISFANFIHL